MFFRFCSVFFCNSSQRFRKTRVEALKFWLPQYSTNRPHTSLASLCLTWQSNFAPFAATTTKSSMAYPRCFACSSMQSIGASRMGEKPSTKSVREIQPECCAQKSRRHFQWKMRYSILKCYVENRTLYHLLSYRPIKPQYSKYSAGISMVFCIITQINNRVLLKEALYASNLHSR